MIPESCEEFVRELRLLYDWEVTLIWRNLNGWTKQRSRWFGLRKSRFPDEVWSIIFCLEMSHRNLSVLKGD